MQALIREYLVHFEGLVVSCIHLFSLTSSILVQERVLFMMVQLLHLRVSSFVLYQTSLLNVLSLNHPLCVGRLCSHVYWFIVMYHWYCTKSVLYNYGLAL